MAPPQYTTEKAQCLGSTHPPSGFFLVNCDHSERIGKATQPEQWEQAGQSIEQKTKKILYAAIRIANVQLKRCAIQDAPVRVGWVCSIRLCLSKQRPAVFYAIDHHTKQQLRHQKPEFFNGINHLDSIFCQTYRQKNRQMRALSTEQQAGATPQSRHSTIRFSPATLRSGDAGRSCRARPRSA